MITSMSACGPCLIRFKSSMPSTFGIFKSVTTTSNVARCEFLDGLLAVGRRDHLVPLRGQIVGQRHPLDLFVVDDEDFHAQALTSTERSGLS